ncbi:MAG: hypothetical protein ACOX9B_12975 [Candidatus Xenobium sp.]|nr:hypothetical protein [Burkholderiales bacterium]
MPRPAGFSKRLRHLFHPIRRLWGFQTSTPSLRTEDQNPFEEAVHLDRILILLARRADYSEELRLMTRRMSSREVHFQTRADLREGQALHLQLLLEPGFSLRVQAQVTEADWVEGECRGRLRLSCGPFEQGALKAYLAKRNLRRFA